MGIISNLRLKAAERKERKTQRQQMQRIKLQRELKQQRATLKAKKQEFKERQELKALKREARGNKYRPLVKGASAAATGFKKFGKEVAASRARYEKNIQAQAKNPIKGAPGFVQTKSVDELVGIKKEKVPNPTKNKLKIKKKVVYEYQ